MYSSKWFFFSVFARFTFQWGAAFFPEFAKEKIAFPRRKSPIGRLLNVERRTREWKNTWKSTQTVCVKKLERIFMNINKDVYNESMCGVRAMPGYMKYGI